MKILRLEKNHLAPWLDEMARRVDLYVPVRAQGESFRLERYRSFEEMDLSYMRTILPPKKVLFPPDEVLWRKTPGGDYDVPSIPNREVVLFGLHPCDIHGIRILDTFFSNFNSLDHYYQRRRQQVRLVGHSCMPDQYCFCASMNTDTVRSGFDLFLYDLGDVLLVHLGTVEGDLLLGGRADAFPEATEHDKRRLIEFLERRNEAFTLELESELVPEALKLRSGAPVWQDLGEQCLSCGTCSLGCPTCTCFNVVDRNDLEIGAERHRVWDACLYRDFALVAGGKNFRGERSERLRNRYYHKQVGFAEKFGKPSCVGCGRCIRMCPTGIHYVEVFRALQEAARE